MLYPLIPFRPKQGAVPPFVPGIRPLKQALTVVFLLTCVAAAAAPPAQAASCRVPGGRTVATGQLAKLIAVPTPEGSALFACIRRSGRKVALDDSFRDARLAGRWVAWQRAGGDRGWRIAVHDLRSGKERLVNGHVAEHSLGLTTRGSIVWAQQQDNSLDTPLYANEVGTGGRLLDGGAVDATSVELGGRQVSWLSGGLRHSAILR
jgi:hypothetical protein